MMRDIARICHEPDRRGPRVVPRHRRQGRSGRRAARHLGELPRRELRPAVPQPALIRDWRLFHLLDDNKEPELRVDAIHDERGYRRIRRAFARQYDIAWLDPDIQVVDVDLAGDRKLILHHNVLNRITAGRPTIPAG